MTLRDDDNSSDGDDDDDGDDDGGGNDDTLFNLLFPSTVHQNTSHSSFMTLFR